MRNWLGLGLLLVGAWFAWSGLAQRRRVLAGGRRAPAPDQAAPTHASLAILRDVMPGLTNAFLIFVALKSVLIYLAVGGSRLVSPFDLAGFLVLLAGYGTWLHCKAKFHDVAPAEPEVIALCREGPADDELERADLPRDVTRAGRGAHAGGLAAGRAQARAPAPRAARRRSA